MIPAAVNSCSYPSTTNTSCGNNTQSQAAQPSSTEAGGDTSKSHKPSAKETRQLQKLKARDREVHAHEAAHIAAAGGLAGGASFSYEIGPDGQRYAVGGEVSIDTSAVPDNPEATLRKAETIRAAALAPRQPSSQDLAVAAQAAQMAIEARMELTRKSDEEKSTESPAAGSKRQADSYRQVAATQEDAGVNLLNAYA